MILVSSWCYVEILRQKGKYGENSVAPINEVGPSLRLSNGIYFVENGQEMLNREEIENELFSRAQKQQELKKQKAEIDSAILSLKTNLCSFLVLISLFVSVAFLSHESLTVVLLLVKNLTPVLTSVFNFVKICNLMQNSCQTFLTSFWSCCH
jgi:hypothetical protein